MPYLRREKKSAVFEDRSNCLDFVEVAKKTRVWVSGIQFVFGSISTFMVLFCVLISPVDIFYLAANTSVYTKIQGTKTQTYFHEKKSKRECRLLWNLNAFPSICLLERRVFSIFRQKMNGPNPSEKDIYVLFPTLTVYIQANYCTLHNWRD